MKYSTTVLFAALTASASMLAAQEEHIKRSELPKAVQAVVDEQSKGGEVKGFAKESNDGHLSYEAQLVVNGRHKDVTMNANGNVLEIEEEVTLDQLPQSVREGLSHKAGKGRVTKVESLTKRGVLVAYEAQVLTGNKKSEIQVGPEGKPLDHEE